MRFLRLVHRILREMPANRNLITKSDQPRVPMTSVSPPPPGYPPHFRMLRLPRGRTSIPCPRAITTLSMAGIAIIAGSTRSSAGSGDALKGSDDPAASACDLRSYLGRDRLQQQKRFHFCPLNFLVRSIQPRLDNLREFSNIRKGRVL